MKDVMIFKITGRIDKKHFLEPLKFSIDVRAAKESHAIEKIYAEMGSRHRAKRHQITILNVEEVEEAKEEGSEN